MFAYTFSATPPYQLLSVSREFRLRLPSPSTATSTSTTASAATQAAILADEPAILRPPPPVRAVHIKLRGVEGKPQFPIGLSWASGGGGGSASPSSCVVLSWGHDDAETYVSTLPLGKLLGGGMAVAL